MDALRYTELYGCNCIIEQKAFNLVPDLLKKCSETLLLAERMLSTVKYRGIVIRAMMGAL